MFSVTDLKSESSTFRVYRTGLFVCGDVGFCEKYTEFSTHQIVESGLVFSI